MNAFSDSRLLASSLVLTAVIIGTTGHAQTSQWVKQGATGLLYQRDASGDRILNFSRAGYQGGTQIPAPESVTDRVLRISAQAGDNRASIQSAIDQVSQWSMNSNGYRGVVELAPGQYDISNTLNINASGVILRGAGDGGNTSRDTIIRSTSRDQISVIKVDSLALKYHELKGVGEKVGIIDKVVPAGATSFRVANPGAFKVGEAVNVYRKSTDAWLDVMAEVLGPDRREIGWEINNTRTDMTHERTITRIEGDRVFIHAPISHGIDSRHAIGTIQKYEDKRIYNVGIQGIRGTSVFDASETEVKRGLLQYVDEDHAWDFISLNKVRDAWVTDITAQHMANAAVKVNGMARSITVDGANSIDPVSLITGSRRYTFHVGGGQFILMKNLKTDQARHAFVNGTTWRSYNRGPNVFLNGESTNTFSTSGPHQWLSTGTLYDNLSDDNTIEARQAYSDTLPHGWRGGNMVIWNSESPTFQIQNPPFARNYGIGITGLNGGRTNAVDYSSSGFPGTYDSVGTKIDFNDPDNPMNSLYIQQRLEMERNPEIQQREYWVGDFDGMEADGSNGYDDVYVDPEWLAEINTMDGWKGDLEITGFDNATANRRVPFSFRYALDEGEYVYSAVLTIATKRLGSHSDNDPIYIEGLDSVLAPGTRVNWGMEFENGMQVMDIELFGDVSYLQDGLLNILVVDDRPVDWAALTLNVGPVPEPGAAAISLGAMLGLMRRRRCPLSTTTNC